MTSLADLVARFGGLRVLVIGEAMLDSYLEGSSDRICREAPVPIVTLSGRRDAPGGAANTAANIRSLGGAVTLLSVIGEDAEGALLCEALRVRGVATDHVLARATRRTLAKQRLLAEGRMLLRFDQGNTEAVDEATEQGLIDRLAALWDCDAVVVSDYAYGILTPRVIRALAALQAREPRVILADAKDLTAYRHVALTAVKPNYAEAVRVLGLPALEGGDRADQITSAGDQLLAMTGARVAAVTLDADGAVICERDGAVHRTRARPIAHGTAGAGDTFLGAFALALAAGALTAAAAELASAAAGIVVGKDGTATCSADELRASLMSSEEPDGPVTRHASRPLLTASDVAAGDASHPALIAPVWP